MSLNIVVAGDDAEQLLKNFDVIARQMNYTPQKEALAYAQGVALQMTKNALDQAGVKYTETKPGDAAPPPAAAEQPDKAAEPPAEKPKAAAARKVKNKAPENDPRQTDLVEFAAQGAPPAANLDSEVKVYGFPEGDTVGGPPKSDIPAVEVKAEDTLAALRDVAATGLGMPAARVLLDRFGVKKVSEIKPHQYSAFVKAAAAAKVEGQTLEGFAEKAKALAVKP